MVLANTCKSSVFQLIPTKTVILTLPKKLIWLVLSWHLVFVYQRKYSIHQKHFSWSTQKKKKNCDTWAFLTIHKETNKSQSKGDILSLSKTQQKI